MALQEQDKFEHARVNAAGWLQSIEEMLGRLDTHQGEDWRDSDVARQEIEESVLSVQVRSGWYSPGGDLPSNKPEEYEILLTTGGPALRIFGQLDEYGQPHTAELQMQDWGTPWGRYPAPEATLLRFASCFYFGE